MTKAEQDAALETLTDAHAACLRSFNRVFEELPEDYQKLSARHFAIARTNLEGAYVMASHSVRTIMLTEN